VHFHN